MISFDRMAVAEVESMKPIVNEPVKDEKVAMIEEAEKAAGDVGKEVAVKETGKFLIFYAFFSSKSVLFDPDRNNFISSDVVPAGCDGG